MNTLNKNQQKEAEILFSTHGSIGILTLFKMKKKPSLEDSGFLAAKDTPQFLQIILSGRTARNKMWKINLNVLNCHHCASYVKMFGFSFVWVICLM